MKKVIAILLLLILVVTNFATYKITKESVKPEKVIVKQEIEIVKYKYKVKKLEDKEKARLVVRVPLTKQGISKDLVKGVSFTYLACSVNPYFALGLLLPTD